MAAQCGSPPIVELLLEKRVNAGVRDKVFPGLLNPLFAFVFWVRSLFIDKPIHHSLSVNWARIRYVCMFGFGMWQKLTLVHTYIFVEM